MDLRNLLFEAVDKCGVTAKELSQSSGVSEAQISRFRSGGDIAFRNFQKLVDGLPPDVLHKFKSLLSASSEPQSNEEIAFVLELLAEKVRHQTINKSPTTSCFY